MNATCPVPRRLTEDQRRLTEQYDALAARMVRRVLGFSPGSPDFDDAHQEARIGLMVAATTYQPGPVPFKAFAAQGIRQHLWSHGKRAGRRGFARCGPEAAAGLTGHGTDSIVADDMDASDAAQIAEIWSASAELPDRLAAALRMRFADGRTFEEIGATFGFTKQYAGMLVADALDRVRRVLAARN